jgi:hypothetical protein
MVWRDDEEGDEGWGRDEAMNRTAARRCNGRAIARHFRSSAISERGDQRRGADAVTGIRYHEGHERRGEREDHREQ